MGSGGSNEYFVIVTIDQNFGLFLIAHDYPNDRTLRILCLDRTLYKHPLDTITELKVFTPPLT